MKLSENFSLWEFTKSYAAIRKNIDNTPNDDELCNIRLLCSRVLQPLRSHFGRRVRISSGFRSSKLNNAIGGSHKSQHRKGQAADFEIIGLSNMAVARWIEKNLEFDQLILEAHKKGDKNSGWIHCSAVAGKNRQEVISYHGKKWGRRIYVSGLQYMP